MDEERSVLEGVLILALSEVGGRNNGAAFSETRIHGLGKHDLYIQEDDGSVIETKACSVAVWCSNAEQASLCRMRWREQGIRLSPVRMIIEVKDKFSSQNLRQQE